jgi:diketogulonate reductase-like aldo/keto reductase
MHGHFIARRRFIARFASLGLALPTLGAIGALQWSARCAAAEAAKPAARNVRFPDGRVVTALGQGSWRLGVNRHPFAVEKDAMQTGISLGMTLIDTSGNYGGGRSEEFIGRAIAGQRDRVFLVTKVEAGEVEGDGIARACAASLKRLGLGTIDLYLMHSPVSSRQLPKMVEAFEHLRAAGSIRAWGVSNFSRSQMEDLFRVPDGNRCATNQVRYSLKDRRIEADLLPWCKEHAMPVMAYSPLGGEGQGVLGEPTLAQLAAARGCSAAAVALAWVIRSGNVIAIPESGSPEHVRENAVALTLSLTDPEFRALDAAFPA